MNRRPSVVRHLAVLVAALAAAPFLGSCGDGVSPEQGDVELSFRSVASTDEDAPLGSLFIEGRNGTLRIDRMVMLVGDFMLEQSDDACLDVEDDFDPLDECESFIADPVLLDVPLDGSPVLALHERLGTGRFPGLVFDVLDLVEDEGPLGTSILEGRVRSRVPDWPDPAVVLLEGAFITPAGASRPFRVFATGELEVDLDLEVPVRVEPDELVEVTVVVDPSFWLLERDGDVIDLSDPDITAGLEGFLDLSDTFADAFVTVEVVEED